MASSMLSFVKNHLPDNWEETYYTSLSYVLITLDSFSREYQSIEMHFLRTAPVKSIQRVQNPYQYGRYMLRREMLTTYNEVVVFHIVHKDDLTTALKFNCDPRRYDRKSILSENENHPRMYENVSSLNMTSVSPLTDYVVLVLKKLKPEIETQADYYINYIVHF